MTGCGAGFRALLVIDAVPWLPVQRRELATPYSVIIMAVRCRSSALSDLSRCGGTHILVGWCWASGGLVGFDGGPLALTG